jgi:selenocysteine lyase/cysteine desulfurase
VDFLAADGHKWMLGPEGLAVLYVAPALRPRLRLHQYGWHMMAQAGDYESSAWAPAADATRFECGSPNMLGIYGLEASLSLLLEVGMASVQAAIADRVEHLIGLVDRQGFELLSPRELERRAGILTFRVPGVDSAALYRALTNQGVICAHRGGGVRFSPHFYTPPEVLDRAVALAAELAAGLPAG